MDPETTECGESDEKEALAPRLGVSWASHTLFDGPGPWEGSHSRSRSSALGDVGPLGFAVRGAREPAFRRPSLRGRPAFFGASLGILLGVLLLGLVSRGEGAKAIPGFGKWTFRSGARGATSVVPRPTVGPLELPPVDVLGGNALTRRSLELFFLGDCLGAQAMLEGGASERERAFLRLMAEKCAREGSVR